MNPTHFASSPAKPPPTPDPHKYAVMTILIQRVNTFDNEKGAINNSTGQQGHFNCPRKAEMSHPLTQTGPLTTQSEFLPSTYPGVD